MKTIYDFEAKTIDGVDVPLSFLQRPTCHCYDVAFRRELFTFEQVRRMVLVKVIRFHDS